MLIGTTPVGHNVPPYTVAEISANHNGSLKTGIKLIQAVGKTGANAVKVQAYTADTITLDCVTTPFQIKTGPWASQTLHQLYKQAQTPFEWLPDFQKAAVDCGLDFIASVFDPTAVAYLEDLDNIAAYKIASYELVDLPLIQCVAETERPIVLSTGMATRVEIGRAVAVAKHNGTRNNVVLLKCTSAYPAPVEHANLCMIPLMRKHHHCPIGLSDHTLGLAVPVAAVTLGACVVEKHVALEPGGVDGAFSLTIDEFTAMVTAVHNAYHAKGKVVYGPVPGESLQFRRSLFVVKNVKAGQPFLYNNIRSIRPNTGVEPRYLDTIIGKRAVRDVKRGEPFQWDMIVQH